jgi:hypothetical protein
MSAPDVLARVERDGRVKVYGPGADHAVAATCPEVALRRGSGWSIPRSCEQDIAAYCQSAKWLYVRVGQRRKETA